MPAAPDDIAPATRGDIRQLLAELADLRERVAAAQVRLRRPDDAAAAIGISTRKLYQLLAAGMPCVQVGAQRRIDLDEAIAWLREHGAENDE